MVSINTVIIIRLWRCIAIALLFPGSAGICGNKEIWTNYDASVKNMFFIKIYLINMSIEMNAQFGEPPLTSIALLLFIFHKFLNFPKINCFNEYIQVLLFSTKKYISIWQIISIKETLVGTCNHTQLFINNTN